MFSISGRGLIDRGRGLELEIVHRHIPVMEAGDHHVGVLEADVDTHHAATGRAGELRVGGILQRENTGVARLRLEVEIVLNNKYYWRKGETNLCSHMIHIQQRTYRCICCSSKAL